MKWLNRMFDKAEEQDRQVEYIMNMLEAQLNLCYRLSTQKDLVLDKPLGQYIKPIKVEDLV